MITELMALWLDWGTCDCGELKEEQMKGWNSRTFLPMLKWRLKWLNKNTCRWWRSLTYISNLWNRLKHIIQEHHQLIEGVWEQTPEAHRQMTSSLLEIICQRGSWTLKEQQLIPDHTECKLQMGKSDRQKIPFENEWATKIRGEDWTEIQNMLVIQELQQNLDHITQRDMCDPTSNPQMGKSLNTTEAHLCQEENNKQIKS